MAALWERFLAAVEAERKRRRARARRRLALFGVLISGFVLSAVLLGVLVFPTQVRAAGERLARVKAVLADGSGPGGEFVVRELPTPEPVTFTSDAEMVRGVPFPVRLPSCFPKGYGLVEHVYQPFSGSSGILRSEYRNGDRFISISHHDFGGSQGFGYGSGFDKDDDRVSEVKVRRADAILIERKKHEYSRLTWVEGTVLYVIDGHLTTEEIMDMAESMREIRP